MTKNTDQQKIFPLPLTLFEKYFLLDTSVDYPMLLEGKIVLTGNLDKGVFEQAVQKALESHPLFVRKIEKKWGRFLWSGTLEPFAITWLGLPGCDMPSIVATGTFPNDCPLQLFVEKNDDLAVIYYVCHHLRCDAIGLFRFFGDIFAAYAICQGEQIEEHSTIEQARIVERDRFEEKELPEKLGFLQILKETVKGVVQWLSVRPLTLGLSHPSENMPHFGKSLYSIPIETGDELKQFAKRHSVTLNDLAVTLFYAAVAKWQCDLHSSHENEFIRFNIPINMRGQGSGAIPAANMISYAFLTCKIRDCLGGRHELLSNIHEEMQVIKDWQVGFMFLDGLAFFNRIPGGLSRLLRSKRCLASLVFSNAGIIEQSFGHVFRKSNDHKLLFGNVRLESMEPFAPCRRKTHLAIVLATHADKMALCCNYDRRFISDNQMQLLLEYYEREQKELLESKGESP